MPYLRLSYPADKPQELCVGKAKFFSDTPDNWESLVGIKRPGFLAIYRDFPRLSSNEVGDPIFGTLAHCDDIEWLDEHIDSTVAIIFFLGDVTSQERPSECFAYQRFEFRNLQTGDPNCVSFWTKHGRIIESTQSLKIHPPIGARGKLKDYVCHVNTIENRKLLDRFVVNPHDRIAVAIRQYFRTQFSDAFTSPLAEDYALHCGAIEAALDIDGLSPGVGCRFAKLLTDIFGTADRFEEFFLGLYVSRSIFVHGAPTVPPTTSPTKESAAYAMFKKAQAKHAVLRALTRDVIRYALGSREGFRGLSFNDSAQVLLRKVLHSSETWRCAKTLLTMKGCAAKITSMNQEDFKQCEQLRDEMSKCFDWSCVEDSVDDKHVLSAIRSCALIIAKLTKSQGDVYAESDQLGEAADKSDLDFIRKWSYRDPWYPLLNCGTPVSCIQGILRELTRFFEIIK